MDVELIRVVFGIIANVLSIGLFAAAVPTFYRAVKKNNSMEDIYSEEEFLPHYYVAYLTIGCLFYMLYGLPFFIPGNVLMLTAFGTGFAINIACLAIFLLYANRDRMFVASALLTGLLLLGLFFGLVIGLGHTLQTRKVSVALICIPVGFFMIFPRANPSIRLKDRKSVVAALSYTLNGLCWAIYSILRNDKFDFFWVPNAFTFAFGLYQLIRYCVYKSCSTPKSSDDQELAETADKELSQAEHDRKLAQAKYDKKLALQLEHDKIKQALARVELELAELGPVTGLAQNV